MAIHRSTQSYKPDPNRQELLHKRTARRSATSGTAAGDSPNYRLPLAAPSTKLSSTLFRPALLRRDHEPQRPFDHSCKLLQPPRRSVAVKASEIGRQPQFQTAVAGRNPFQSRNDTGHGRGQQISDPHQTRRELRALERSRSGDFNERGRDLRRQTFVPERGGEGDKRPPGGGKPFGRLFRSHPRNNNPYC